MKKRNIFMTLAMLPLMGLAQSLRVTNADINLGQVLFRTPAKATYLLTNTSSETVRIEDVDTGCGCVVAEYQKTDIAPGQQARIDVVYNSEILGTFTRFITVKDSKGGDPLELTLSGKVVTQIESYVGDYPYELGGLLTDVNDIEFDDVRKGDRPMLDIHVFNPTGQYVEPVLMRLPPYLRAEMMPSRIAPKKGGVIRVTLNSNAIHSMGLVQSNVYLAKSASEKVSEDKEIPVSVILLPEQLAQDDAALKTMPHCNVSASVLDMTDFAGKEKLKREVILTNTGKSNLEIQSLQMLTRGLEVVLPKRSLKPGESTKMKITGNAAQLAKVRTRPRILMITNDLSNPKVVIEIKK